MLSATKKEREWNARHDKPQKMQSNRPQQKIKLRDAPPLTFETLPPMRGLHKLIHGTNTLRTNVAQRIKYVPITKSSEKIVIFVRFDAENRRLHSTVQQKRSFKNVPPAPLKWSVWSHQTRSKLFTKSQ